MNTHDEDDSFEEFEQEFYPENIHPLQALGAVIIGIGAIGVLLWWIVSLINVLRH